MFNIISSATYKRRFPLSGLLDHPFMGIAPHEHSGRGTPSRAAQSTDSLFCLDR